MKSDRKILGLLLLALATCTSGAWAGEHNYSLILAEYGKDSAGEQTLVRYHFRDGVMVGKEDVLTTRTFALRYDIGPNQIFDNRYVITVSGDVVDLASGQMLFKSKGTMVDLDKDSRSVIVRISRADAEGAYTFDLATMKYQRMKNPGFWDVPGILSPNRQLSAGGDGTEIWVHDLSGKKSLLGNVFLRSGIFECSSLLKPTFVWADNEHLLTLEGNSRIVLVDLQGKVEPVATLREADTGPGPAGCGPELRRDSKGQFYYEQGFKTWRIDVANRTFVPYLWEAVDNEFEVEHQQSQLYGHIIRHQGKEIGRWWCASPVTAPGYIAITFGAVGSNLGHPEGVKVWSAETNEWTTIKPDWLTTIIGWVAE